jgi:cytochrome P450
MRRLTQTIIVRAVFGEVPPAELHAISEALDLAVARVDRRLWSALGWLEAPTPARAKYRRALGIVHAFVARRVSAARHAGPSPGTLLAALLDHLSDAELYDELKAFLVAGHTTTASALAWTWYVLSEHPEARGQIEQESRDVLAGRAPGAGDLPRLGYTRRVIEEVLRLYPPTWLTARTAAEDDELGGYRIPAGALILLSPYVTHRHPAVWEAPERFDPDRFAPKPSAARPAFAHFPFGAARAAASAAPSPSPRSNASSPPWPSGIASTSSPACRSSRRRVSPSTPAPLSRCSLGRRPALPSRGTRQPASLRGQPLRAPPRLRCPESSLTAPSSRGRIRVRA